MIITISLIKYELIPIEKYLVYKTVSFNLTIVYCHSYILIILCTTFDISQLLIGINIYIKFTINILSK